MRQAARKIANAMHRANVQQQRERPGGQRATIIGWRGPDDFRLDLHGCGLELDEEDVVLGQTVLRYHAANPLKVGDTLLLNEPDEGEFVAVDVEG